MCQQGGSTYVTSSAHRDEAGLAAFLTQGPAYMIICTFSEF